LLIPDLLVVTAPVPDWPLRTLVQSPP
jgi:hypothetical protein